MDGDGEFIYAPDDINPLIRAEGMELRFAIGENLSCRLDSGWLSGKVAELWPGTGHVYMIQLDKGSECFAPEENDSYIKRA